MSEAAEDVGFVLVVAGIAVGAVSALAVVMELGEWIHATYGTAALIAFGFILAVVLAAAGVGIVAYFGDLEVPADD